MKFELTYNHDTLALENGKKYPWHLKVYFGVEKPYCMHIGNYETFEQAEKFIKQYEKIFR